MKEEREEALMSLVGHYGLPVFMDIVDQIVDRIAKGVLSVPLDKDPEKAAITLYAERMKAEGAAAVRTALVQNINAIREKRK